MYDLVQTEVRRNKAKLKQELPNKNFSKKRH